MEIINGPGDAVPHIISLLGACMASGGNVYQGLNCLQMALDHVKSDPLKFVAARPQLPEGHRLALEEAFGACGEGGDLGERGTA
jgi:hypothetical protein